MIKLLALLLMLIDHIGIIIYPNNWTLRLIGRLSMPLFGYCIARGFYYSKKHGTIKRYVKNLAIFTIVSEIPYMMMVNEFAINIGFTWLVSVCILAILESDIDKGRKYLIASTIFIFAAGFYFLVKYSYGIYGCLVAICMYYLMIKKNEPYKMFLALVVLWAFYVLVMHQQLLQFFSVFSIIIIALLRRYDTKIMLPKWIYYWFYPLHITILVLIERMFV